MLLRKEPASRVFIVLLFSKSLCVQSLKPKAIEDNDRGSLVTDSQQQDIQRE